MGKKDEGKAPEKQLTDADKLLKDGELCLMADSRMALYVKGEKLLKDLPEGTDWTRSCVLFVGGTFHQMYSILKQD